MRNAARNVLEITAGTDYDAFIDNEVLRLAVERLIEIIGEASRRITTGFKQLNPDIPWADILGQRNILAHEYGDIDYELLWDVVENGLPDLLARLDAVLPPEPPSEA